MEYTIGTKVFGEWEIVAELGEGASGKVFEIHKKMKYGGMSKAALKVIRVPQSDAEVRAVRAEGMDNRTVTGYFQGVVEEIVKEINVMESLKSSTGIVSCEDSDVIEHPGDFGWDILIRMELLTSLQEYRQEHATDETEVLRMAKDLCSALVFCQKKGMIHRDIKPGNIFVNEAGDFKLGDFGVARTLDRTTGGLSKKGTESYMAPEVYLSKPYGSSVDLYSLGLVLYQELNDGRLPFMPPAPQPIRVSDRENALNRRVVKGEPIPMPKNAAPEFGAIIQKACAWNPDERYRTAAEMLEALECIGRSDGRASMPEQSEVNAADRIENYMDEQTIGAPGESMIAEEEATIGSPQTIRPTEEATIGEAGAYSSEEATVGSPQIVQPVKEETVKAVEIPEQATKDTEQDPIDAIFSGTRLPESKKSRKSLAIAGVVLALCALFGVIFFIRKNRLGPLNPDPAEQTEVWRTVNAWLTQFSELTDEQLDELETQYKEETNHTKMNTITHWKEEREDLGEYWGLEQAALSMNGVYTGYARYKDAGRVKVTCDMKDQNGISWEPVDKISEEEDASAEDVQMSEKWADAAGLLWDGLQTNGIDYRETTMEEAADYWVDHGLRFSDGEGGWYDDLVYYPQVGHNVEIRTSVPDVSYGSESYETTNIGSVSVERNSDGRLWFNWDSSVWYIYLEENTDALEKAREAVDQVMPYPAGISRDEDLEDGLVKLGITQEMQTWIESEKFETKDSDEQYVSCVLSAEKDGSVWVIRWSRGDTYIDLSVTEQTQKKEEYISISWSSVDAKDDSLSLSMLSYHTAERQYPYFSDMDQEEKGSISGADESVLSVPGMTHVSVDGGNMSSFYRPGSRVVVEADNRLEDGYEFVGWTSDGNITFVPISREKAIINVPDADTTVKARYGATTMPEQWEAVIEKFKSAENSVFWSGSLEEVGEELEAAGWKFADSDDYTNTSYSYTVCESDSSYGSYRTIYAQPPGFGEDDWIEIEDAYEPYDEGKRSGRKWFFDFSEEDSKDYDAYWVDYLGYPFVNLLMAEEKTNVSWLGLTPEMLEWVSGEERTWGDYKIGWDEVYAGAGEYNFTLGYEPDDYGYVGTRWYIGGIGSSYGSVISFYG